MFDAVMLQQIGLNVQVNPQTGNVVLCEIPERIPAPAHPGDARAEDMKDRKGVLAFLLGVFMALSYPFTRIASILRAPLRETSTRRGRQVIPARHQTSDATEPTLQTDLPDNYEAAEELKDALSPLYDQLDANLLWTFIEYLPLRVKKQKAIVKEEQGFDGFHWMCVSCARTWFNLLY